MYCGAVHVTRSRAWVTDNALIVDVKKAGILTDYLAAALTYADLNQYAGKSAQPLVSGSRIYPVEILVPPVALQSAFAKHMDEIDKLGSRYENQLTHLDALFASLQDRIFLGEQSSAVPTDANVELELAV